MGTPTFLFCYVSSNSNFCVTGGGAVIDEMDKRIRGEGAITEFPYWARQSYGEANA
jgi:hypothetical protein